MTDNKMIFVPATQVTETKTFSARPYTPPSTSSSSSQTSTATTQAVSSQSKDK